MLILGNKKEMIDSRVISYEEGDDLALKYEYYYREVSNKIILKINLLNKKNRDKNGNEIHI